MIPRRIHLMKIALLSLYVFLPVAAGCGANPDPAIAPQTHVARYAGDFMESVSVVQKFVASASQIPEATKAQAMQRFLQVSDAGKRLSQLLAAYDAASSVSERNTLAGNINGVLNSLSILVLEIQVPIGDQSVRQEISRLLSNSAKILMTIQSLVPQVPTSPETVVK